MPTSHAISETACRAAAQLGRTVNRAIDTSTLTPAAYRMLAYLSTGNFAAKVLAAKLAVSRPTVTATLDWLELRRLAIRLPDPHDRRGVTICITEEGLDALHATDGLVGNRLGEVLGDLPDGDATAVLRALEILHDALNRYRARGTSGEHVPAAAER